MTFVARIACVLSILVAAGGAQAAERTVVVVLFDGFAPAMVEAAETPNLDRIAREGAWSHHLVPAFPTISLINHTTFQTGCWPEHHGILSNVFEDPEKGRFDGSPDPDWRTGCESLWEAAERQNVRAAALNFVGRWSETRGKRATHANPIVPFAELPSDEETVAEAINLLRDDGPEHPRLIAIYLHGPDWTAHFSGTTAPETLADVRKADALVGELMEAIEALPEEREAALVIGTDHGMVDVAPLINVGSMMFWHGIEGKQAADGASVFFYLDDPSQADRIASELMDYDYAFDVFKKGAFPAYAHLGTGPRAPDLLLVAKPPYWTVGPEKLPSWAAWVGVNWLWPVVFTPFTGGSLKANHGYDPAIPEMHGIFYAWGAGVARGVEVDRLDMIDMHPTAMTLLGLVPGEPVDGQAIEAVSRPESIEQTGD